jgi:hypothetical protein
MHRLRCGAALAFGAVIAAGCGGDGTFSNGSVVNSPGGPPTQPPPNLVNVKVTVTVPPRKRGAILPNYVSVNTQSLVIQLSSVNGQPISGVSPKTIDTIARARGCKLVSGATVCTATALGAPGRDVFSVTTYAGVNANGSVLSVGSVEATIKSGGDGVTIDNRLSLTLCGVIAALKLSVLPNSGKRGDPMEASVELAAFDASGAQIVGPSDFDSPIALAIQGDSRRAFLLLAQRKSGSSLSIAKPTSSIALKYNGDAQATSVTLAASVDGPGSIGASANFTLRGKQPPPPVGTIYALNLGSNDGKAATVTEYDGKTKGDAAPVRTLSLDAKLYARSIGVDSSGNLYVGYFDNAYGFSPSDGTPDKGNEIAIYPPNASGHAQPSAVLTADQKTETTIFPLFMAVDPSSDLITYGATGVDGVGGYDAVLTYSAGSSGEAAPADAWAFNYPTLDYAGPTGLALDGDGNFYVNGALHSSLGPSYGLFVALASDNGNPAVSPSRTIPWDSKTELAPGLTTNVSLNDTGEVFIANTTLQGSGSTTSCQGHVNVYSAGSTGGTTDVPPLRVLTLAGVFTQNPQCDSTRDPLAAFFPSITLYDTQIFVVDDFNNAIDVFSSNAHGTVKPVLQIKGSATGLNAPTSIVITPRT